MKSRSLRRQIASLRTETLEQRILLAADLALNIAPFANASPGETVTREIRVFNNGDEAADTLVQAVLSDQLIDATWERSGGLAQQRSSSNDGLQHEVTLELQVRDSIRISNVQVIPDVNGDQVRDYFAHGSGEFDYLIFGIPSESNQQGAAKVDLDDIPQTVGSYPSSPGIALRREREPTTVSVVGDINGDSVGDLLHGSYVLFGSNSLGQSGPVDLRFLNGTEGFRVVSDGQPSHDIQIGDFNGDGVDDLLSVGANAITFGSHNIGRDGQLDVAKELRAESGSAIQLPFESASYSIGDFDADGVDDLVVGFGQRTMLLQGTTELSQPGHVPATLDVQQTLNSSASPFIQVLHVGDMNGDSIDDVAYGMYGWLVQSTASGKEIAFTRKGVDILFGQPTLFEYEQVDIATHGATFSVVMDFLDTPVFSADDVNGDGLVDVIIQSSKHEYVVLGRDGLSDIDLNYGDLSGFDGRNGFAIPGDANTNDRDETQLLGGTAYGLRRESPIGSVPSFSFVVFTVTPDTNIVGVDPKSGTLDIADRISIPPGESVIYTATGTLKPDARRMIRATAVTQSGDSYAIESHTGQPTVDVRLTNETAPSSFNVGDAVVFEATIENTGPHAALDVRVVDSISSTLANASWSIETQRLFPDLNKGWTHQLGADLLGFEIPPLDSFGTAFAEFPNLGSEIGLLGDINRDGKDDFFANDLAFLGQDAFSSESLTQQKPTPTIGHFFVGSQRVQLTQEDAEVYEVADLNNDGKTDFLAHVPRKWLWRSNVWQEGKIYVLFQSGAMVAFSPLELDAAGVLVEMPEPFVASVKLPVVDFNQDGYNDILIDTVHDRRIEVSYAILGGSNTADAATTIDITGSPTDETQPTPPIASTVGHFFVNGRRVSVEQSDAEIFPIGDLNADGIQDFAAFSSLQAQIIFGDASLDPLTPIDLTSYPSVDFPPGWRPVVGSLHDHNGDQIPDFIFRSNDAADDLAELIVVYGAADLASRSTITASSMLRSQLPQFSPQRFEVGDFNDDGVTDLVAAGNGLAIYFGGEDFGKSNVLQIPSGKDLGDPSITHAQDIVVLDANGDGVDDLLMSDPEHRPTSDGFGEAGRVYLLMGRQAKSFTGTGAAPIPPFHMMPGERVTVRISGIVTESTLQNELELSVVPADDSFELNPSNNAIRFESSNGHAADIDQNGVVDFADFLILADNFGQQRSSRSDGDVNLDGTVDLQDFILLRQSFGERRP